MSRDTIQHRYRIGCDVGGTNTDAIILDTHLLDSSSSPGQAVISKYKTPTTSNVTNDIKTAIEQVLLQAEEGKIHDVREKVSHVSIGTTHFVNAVVEGDTRRLSRVAVVRLCGEYTKSVCSSLSCFAHALQNETVNGL